MARLRKDLVSEKILDGTKQILMGMLCPYCGCREVRRILGATRRVTRDSVDRLFRCGSCFSDHWATFTGLGGVRLKMVRVQRADS